ncbi:MAG: hypothetical protein HZA53_11140 [Planctomycetes bacterium]|nr:hypothetical protein [Planctomycetota bacterium]
MKHGLLLTVSLALTACSAPRIEATPEYGKMRMSGEFAIATAGVASTNDLKDLGLDDEEGTPGARVDLKWGLPHLSFSVSKFDTSGSGTTTADLSQGAVTIPAGTNVDSDVELIYGNAILTFDFVPGDTVEVGLGFGVEAASLQTSVKPSAGGAGVDTDESVPIPVLALRAGVDLGSFQVDGLLTGIKAGYSGDDLTFYDLDLRARWEVFDHAHLLLGYKRWTVDLEYDDGADNVALDVTADGPYLGFVLAF